MCTIVFPARRSLCPHNESDSIKYPPIRTIPSLLCNVLSQSSSYPPSVAVGCCLFGISESAICHHLHAVIAYEVSFDSLSSVDPRIDFTRSFYDQALWFRPGMSIRNHLLHVHGLLHFYHKSFYDFLRDPARSGVFCVNTSAFHIKLFHHLIKQYHHCASTYAIDGSSTYFPALQILD